MTEKAKHPVQTLEKTLRIISVLQELHSARLSRIATEVEMGKSAVHNHLNTLREHEYVIKEEDEYKLSLQFLNISGSLLNEFKLYRVAMSEVERLARSTGELVTLATEELGRAVIIYRAQGEQAVDLDTYVGSQLTMHNTALGKAILAHISEDRMTEVVDKHGLPDIRQNTITDAETLSAELEEVKERGYAFDDEEQWRGLQCIAAPILTKDDAVEGAISISAPKSRMEEEHVRQEYVDGIQNTANIIELDISYS